MASERGWPASPPRQRSLVRRVLRAVAIAVGSLLLVAASRSRRWCGLLEALLDSWDRINAILSWRYPTASCS
jgi:hypothetical protein